jgi:YidC/Oxa1 family membrane protein insertase
MTPLCKEKPLPKARSRILSLLILLCILLPLGAGCGSNVPVPDLPAQAVTEGKTREEAAQKAETDRAANATQLWTETAQFYGSVARKFSGQPEGLAAVQHEARITDAKLKNTYQAWTQIRNGLKPYINSPLPEREAAFAQKTELETKLDAQNSESPYYKVMNGLVTLLGGDPRYSPVLALFLIAIFITVAVWPLSYRQYKAAKEMMRFQPEIKKIQEKYKDDPMLLNQKIQAFNKEHGVNMFAGCLPAVAQLPIFFLLFQLITHYQFHFSKTHFLWINPAMGVQSLTWPAPLTGILGHHLGEPDVPLLLGYAALQFLQFRMTPPPSDPTQAEQQRMMGIFMPVMYFMMMLQYQLPSAFVLYYFVSSMLGMGRQWIINRSLPELAPFVPIEASAGGDNGTRPGALASNPRLISPKNQKKGGSKR